MAYAVPNQSKVLADFLWRRLDQPGHDCCRLFRHSDGWKLQGMAVFRESGQSCNFAYEVSVDSTWTTLSAGIAGFRGRKAVDMRIRRTAAGQWRVGSELQHAVANCVDIDLGFTPATNMLAVRRLSLVIGARAEAPAAWLALPSMKLRVLPQIYLRSAKFEYDYEAPTVGYKSRLQVSKSAPWCGIRACSSLPRSGRRHDAQPINEADSQTASPFACRLSPTLGVINPVTIGAASMKVRLCAL